MGCGSSRNGVRAPNVVSRFSRTPNSKIRLLLRPVKVLPKPVKVRLKPVKVRLKPDTT